MSLLRAPWAPHVAAEPANQDTTTPTLAALPDEPPVAPPAPAAIGDGFRPDLEGLRGLAILAVLLFHAGIPGIAGGFVGVDVFFVLSGFLITGLLLRERETTGRIRLPTFYARRARRLLPAAAVSLLAILVAAWLFLPPLDVPGVAQDVAAAIASVGNIRFALEANDYFADDVTRSPVLHFWSLGVEEQFYLVWPALLILATRLARPRVGAAVLLGLVLVASLGTSIWLTNAAPPWAFYSLPTRAWQLALGGLLAAGAVALARLSGWAALTLGWAGLVAVVASVFIIEPTIPYPGVAALLPALGTAALIATGQRARSPGLLLATAPMRFLGRISYSLYLVHWPILVIPAASLGLGQVLSLNDRLGLAGLAVVVGWLSYRFVEAPFHHGRRVLRIRPSQMLAASGAVIAATLVVSLAADVEATRRLDDPAFLIAAAARNAPSQPPLGLEPPVATPSAGGSTEPTAPTAPGTTPGPTIAPTPSPGGEEGNAPEGTPQPEDSLEPEPTDLPSEVPGGSPGSSSGAPGSTGSPAPSATPYLVVPLPPDLQPRLSQARGDVERLNPDGCTLEHTDVEPRECVYGDRDGTITVALVGDSHAAQWFPAFERIAREHHWRLVTHTKVSCRFFDMRFISRVLKREYTECERWREKVVERLVQLKPDLVVTSLARVPQPVIAADDSPTRQGEALARMLKEVPGQKAIIVDTPTFGVDPPTCLSSAADDTSRCGRSWQAAFGWRYLILERTAARATGASIVDLSTTLCPERFCRPMDGSYITFRDYQHLTATYSAALADRVFAQLPVLAAPR